MNYRKRKAIFFFRILTLPTLYPILQANMKAQGSLLGGSDDGTIRRFKDMLNKKGILTTIRISRGQDISAACGMLSTRKLHIRQIND